MPDDVAGFDVDSTSMIVPAAAASSWFMAR
jgi:hypothetical protein